MNTTEHTHTHTHTHTIHIYNGILLSYFEKRDEILPFSETWMDLETVIQDEVKSEREKLISYNIVYVSNLEKWYR